MTWRWPLLLVAVLLIPAVLLGVWGVLTFGGSIERMAEEELRRGEDALAAFELAFRHRLKGVPVGEEPTWREDAQVLDSAMRIGVEFEAQGDPAQALPFLERVVPPLPPRVLLARARALLALGRPADARVVLAQEVPKDLTVDGVPLQLSTAMLVARAGEAGEAEVASAVWRRVLAGEIHVPPILAASVVETLAECAEAPDAQAVADFLWAAKARQALAFGLVERNQKNEVNGNLVALPHGGLLVDGRDELVPPHAVARARQEAREEIRERFDLIVADRVADRVAADVLAEVDLAGTQHVITMANPRGSARLRLVATWCLGLALLAFLAGNLVLYLVVRRTAALSRLRADFIDVVSHELRTPLTALSVRAEMLARGDVPVAKTKDYQRKLYDDVNRLSALVHDVLDFARLERGRYRLAPKRVSVRRLLAQAVRASRDSLRNGGQKLLVDVPRQIPELFVDVEIVARALRNLIDNATKHAPQGSAIELQVEGGPSAVVFSVRDSGPGLGGANPRQLFAPFRKGAGTGSGLGLAIVDRAVRAHGGRVQARERKSGGAEFRIELPASTEEKGEEA